MEPLKPKTRPEDVIVKRIKEFLILRGWYVKKMHGNLFQSGVPDLYCAKKNYGARWIEVKTEKGRLEASQIENFHLLAAAGVGVWVFTDMNEELYKQLCSSPPNWWTWNH